MLLQTTLILLHPLLKSNATSNCKEICEICDCHVFHQYTLQITNGKRDDLHKHLLENGIPNAIYYPVALHAQKAYTQILDIMNMISL